MNWYVHVWYRSLPSPKKEQKENHFEGVISFFSSPKKQRLDASRIRSIPEKNDVGEDGACRMVLIYFIRESNPFLRRHFAGCFCQATIELMDSAFCLSFYHMVLICLVSWSGERASLWGACVWRTCSPPVFLPRLPPHNHRRDNPSFSQNNT